MYWFCRYINCCSEKIILSFGTCFFSFFLKIYYILHNLFQPDTLTGSSFPTTTIFSDLIFITISTSLGNMKTNGWCLHSQSKRDDGIWGVILSGDISSIPAKWGAQLQVNVDSWKVIKIPGKTVVLLPLGIYTKELSLPCTGVLFLIEGRINIRSPVIHWTWKKVAKHLQLTDEIKTAKWQQCPLPW